MGVPHGSPRQAKFFPCRQPNLGSWIEKRVGGEVRNGSAWRILPFIIIISSSILYNQSPCVEMYEVRPTTTRMAPTNRALLNI